MSYGNMMSVPFSDPTLVAQAVTHSDYQDKGYVWGTNGNLHYCFVDPERKDFNIWKKRFHKDKLNYLGINSVAGLVMLFFTRSPLEALLLFFAIPTAIPMFLYHYRDTAKEQNAAVVTNGPQMQYPGRLKTSQMVWEGLKYFSLGFLLSLSASAFLGAIKTGIVIGGRTLISAGGLKVLYAVGSGINISIVLLFLLGWYKTKPFGIVTTPSFTDIPNPMVNGWYHLGTNGRGLPNYRIAPGQPSGLLWACAGLLPVVVDGSSAWTLTSPEGQAYRDLCRKSRDLETTPVVNKLVKLDLVVWGLICRGEDPKDPLYYTTGPVDLIVVLGVESWSDAYAQLLIMHGCKQAVATDGFLSPIMGTHGNLILDSIHKGALDVIQKYGFSMETE